VTSVWIGPSATSFSCLCEPCLETARIAGVLFIDAISSASVRGEIAREAETASVRCAAGHQIVLRRVERPASLKRPDEGQLQLA
jgi:hypothetical protein